MMPRLFYRLAVAGDSQDRFSLLNKVKLALLAAVLLGLWIFSGASVMSADEELAWEKVRAAQAHLWQWREERGIGAAAQDDLWHSGLIGLEWSGLTTTLGDLEAKRTATDPAWVVQYLRWFKQLDLGPGDPVSLYSSGSFPGLLVSALVAAETCDLDISLIVSLGSSTWGANHPMAPWPVLAAELRKAGFLKTRADYYTLGGGAETGQGLSPEGAAVLRDAADDAGVSLLSAADLASMTALKFRLVKEHNSKLLISIGGSHANLGADDDVLRLPPGLILAPQSGAGGNGVIANALNDGLPVIHMLHLKRLCAEVGLPFDSEPTKQAPNRISFLGAIAGILIFLIALLRYRRWRLIAEAG